MPQRRPSLHLISRTAIICVLLSKISGNAQSLAANTDSVGTSPPTSAGKGPGIIPLRGHVKIEGRPAEPRLEDLNQCAGTVQHYRLPPVGYLAPTASKSSQEGQKLYDKNNCQSCHAIAGTGGQLGPPLDGIGGHRGPQWLMARLLDPEQQMREFPEVFGGRPNIMPHPGVSKSEASKIVSYLLTLPEPSGGFLITAHPAMEEPIKPPQNEPRKPPGRERPKSAQQQKESENLGRELFVAEHCAMCHTVGGEGGRFGPKLDGIALKYDRESLEHLLSGGAKDEAMKGRTLGLKREDSEHIVDFLLSLPPGKEPHKQEL